MSRLLVAAYLLKMRENVISNNSFENPCGFEKSILPGDLVVNNCAAPINAYDKSKSASETC